MEALTAVATAGLALVDMVKAVDPAASINHVRVLCARKAARPAPGVGRRTAHATVRPADPLRSAPRSFVAAMLTPEAVS